MATPSAWVDRPNPPVPAPGAGLAVGTDVLARTYEAVGEKTPILTKGPGP